MAEDSDESQKTEEPTGKRIQEAEERGQVITSREMTSFFLLLAFTMLLSWIAPGLFRKAHFMLAPFIERPESFATDERGLGTLMIDIIERSAMILFLPFASFVAAIFVSNFMQNRFIFSVEPIIPKLDKLSPIQGLSRMFSMRSVTEFVKSTLKIAVVGFVAYLAVAPYLIYIRNLSEVSIAGMLAFLTMTAHRMLIGVCIVMFFIAFFDYLYQRFEYLKGLRMTKQEVKDEYKQQEGDPQVKRRLRQIRLERARKRMIAAVPTADVIITNPTHYSVALKYDADTMRAPKVVAKGLDIIALRIREVAEENGVPLYENPPLAQALYATVDIDEEVPNEHYKAVAEVISYVYRLKGKIAQPVRG